MDTIVLREIHSQNTLKYNTHFQQRHLKVINIIKYLLIEVK